MLELIRQYSPEAVFIFTSTNKVYGNAPNYLPLKEEETRWEIDSQHPFFKAGINETMSIDQSKHSLFVASKLAADIMVQEFGRYFGMKTGVLRGGCLTPPIIEKEIIFGTLMIPLNLNLITKLGKGNTIYQQQFKKFSMICNLACNLS